MIIIDTYISYIFILIIPSWMLYCDNVRDVSSFSHLLDKSENVGNKKKSCLHISKNMWYPGLDSQAPNQEKIMIMKIWSKLQI
jgi:hypothetical protein